MTVKHFFLYFFKYKAPRQRNIVVLSRETIRNKTFNFKRSQIVKEIINRLQWLADDVCGCCVVDPVTAIPVGKHSSSQNADNRYWEKLNMELKPGF